MTFKPDREKDLLFKDLVAYIEGELGKTEWVTVFEFFEGKYESIDRGSFFSALIPNQYVASALEKADWDLTIGEGRPGFISTFSDGEENTKYDRLSDHHEAEPFIHWRSFRNRDEAIIEISEEFRLYFDLFEYTKEGKKIFLYTNDDGEEEEVAVIEDNQVDVKLKYLKEYLAAKNAHMAIYFEAMRFLDKKLEDSGIDPVDEVVKNDNYTYSLYTRNLSLRDFECQGWLLGKKLIAGAQGLSFSLWSSKEDEKFEDFVIGIDENGKDVLASASADYKSNPGFLTPVFFKREVLKKYYDSPSVFSVNDGDVTRDGFWRLRMMNNHTEHVVVWLGNLKGLPYKEQTHWRAFNVTPSNRKISAVDFGRNIEGLFADPEHPELYFKYKFQIFQEAWYEKFGWYLFLPLRDDDKYHLKSLHVPTTEEQKEFEDQVLSISKIFIDSLNQSELKKGLTSPKDEPRQIDWLQAFFESKGLQVSEIFEFLRMLQALRSSSVAHRKGDKTKAPIKYFELDSKGNIEVFQEIVIKCIRIMDTFQSRVGIKNDD